MPRSQRPRRPYRPRNRPQPPATDLDRALRQIGAAAEHATVQLTAALTAALAEPHSAPPDAESGEGRE